MWRPWKRARIDIADSRRRAAAAEQQSVEAERKNDEAEAGRQAALRLDVKSRAITHGLRVEVDKNGFTEMLQQSWGRRGHA